MIMEEFIIQHVSVFFCKYVFPMTQEKNIEHTVKKNTEPGNFTNNLSYPSNFNQLS